MTDEISTLIAILHETEQRLEELTAGEVDTVADGNGRTFLLRRAQEELRDVEATRQAAILNALPAHIALLDIKGIIISANNGWRQFGHASVIQGSGYQIGLNYLDVCDRAQGDGSSEAHLVAAGIRSVMMGDKERFSIEFPVGPSAECHWYSLTVTPLADFPSGGVVVMYIDITNEKRAFAASARQAIERQETEARERLTSAANHAALQRLSRHLADARDRAEQANRAKSRFLAGMSHELRTPLNGILGYAHLLRMEGGLNPAQDARVTAMLEAGEHLLEMIACVLDLSEIEANHLVLRPIALDVRSIATACLDLIRPLAEAKGLGLSITMAPGTRRELIADPTRLRQILLNLLGNAAKFTSRGAIKLHIRTLADDSGLRLEIADTGPGISFDQHQRLFQDFERLDVEAPSKIEGAGLGLALSARLATLMGGRIGYDDNAGGGSVFWLELPVDNVAVLRPDQTSASDASDGETAPACSLHVLVVDDVLMNREIAGSFLRLAGHQVICVEGGAAAVAAVASTNFDVVLMDVRMPDMDGLEATRRIRALEGTRRHVPIVALTAHAFVNQIAECREAGMDSYLGKPFNPDALLAAVMRVVNRGPAHTADAESSDLTSPPIDEAAATVIPVIGTALLVLNSTTFEQTARYLSSDTLVSYLRIIAERCDDLLRGLSEPDALIHARNELADAAHTLAGSAGIFGFEHLTDVGRRFERAAQSSEGGASALTQDLIAALEATLQVIRKRTQEPFLVDHSSAEFGVHAT